MKTLKLILAGVLLASLPLFCLSCGNDTPDETEEDSVSTTVTPGDYASITDVAASNGITYASDAGQLCIYLLENGKETARIALDAAPNAIALNDNGSVLYAVCGEENGRLIRVNTAERTVTGTADIGHTPTDVVYHSGSLYITERFDNTVRKVDAETLATTASAKTVREPIGAAAADDILFVAAHLPEEAATSTDIASDVGMHKLSDLSETGRINLTNGSTGVRGIAASANGKKIYVAHTLGRYNVATTHLDRGWVYTNAISVIEAKYGKLLATVLLDDIDKGAANPWGIVCTDDTIAVTIAGTGELITLDEESLTESIADSDDRAAIADTLDFAYRFKTRTDLGESGVRAIAYDGTSFITANYYYGTVQYIDAETLKVTAAAGFETAVPPTEERLGEILWNDASICYQQWMTCASCHPDARTDALNWDNLNDGMGTPKQARTLLHTFERGRVMATGIRADAAVGVRAGAKYICFNDGITEEELSRIDAYIKSLEPVESPYYENGTLSESALRGKAIFEGKANCASCHSSSVYGADILIENHTQVGNEKRGLLVPPLTEVWRTAPYLYDGRAVTIREVLTDFNPLDENGKPKHGSTADLTEEEMQDLIEFVLSITEKRDTASAE